METINLSHLTHKIAKVCCMYQGMLLLTDHGEVYQADTSLVFNKATSVIDKPVISLETSYYRFYYQTDDYVVHRDGGHILETQSMINGPVQLSCGGYHVWIKNVNDKNIYFCGENAYHESVCCVVKN
jgi:hypothetical protein